ncbi:hypothetical protein C8R46DRAFT_1233721 [Mycena filopes]|nr:hypothetical protein C8R46DRAFT_1233721 [Mycena filopes]
MCLLQRARAAHKPHPSPTEKIWVDTRTTYRLTLPDPLPILTSTVRWPAGTAWRPSTTLTDRWPPPMTDWWFESFTASGCGIWHYAPPNETEKFVFGRLREGKEVAHPEATEQGAVYDTRECTIRISDTGIVMVRYRERVVLYWYL